MKVEELDYSKKYTYTDYLSWQFDEMVEIIRGKIYRMTPAPNLNHQEVSSNLLRQIFLLLDNKKCKVFHAPFDVRLPLGGLENEEIDTVVQPDICVVCDPEKLHASGCLGAPDWIIEILSPSTSKKDLNEKFDLYESAGVKVYWVIHPHEQTLLVFTLDEGGKYKGRLKPYTRDDQVELRIFDDFVVNLEEVFPLETL